MKRMVLVPLRPMVVPKILSSDRSIATVAQQDTKGREVQRVELTVRLNGSPKKA